VSLCTAEGLKSERVRQKLLENVKDNADRNKERNKERDRVSSGDREPLIAW